MEWSAQRFTYLQQYANVNGYNGLTNGAVVSASITNGVITGYLNGVPIIRATDNTFTNGNPGMGFWLDGASPSVETDYGFTSFTATDGTTNVLPTSARPTSFPECAANLQTSGLLRTPPPFLGLLPPTTSEWRVITYSGMGF